MATDDPQTRIEQLKESYRDIMDSREEIREGFEESAERIDMAGQSRMQEFRERWGTSALVADAMDIATVLLAVSGIVFIDWNGPFIPVALVFVTLVCVYTFVKRNAGSDR